MINLGCRHTIEELQELVETAKHAVPGVDAAIAAAIDRKLNPVSHLCMQAIAMLGVASSLHYLHNAQQTAF